MKALETPPSTASHPLVDNAFRVLGLPGEASAAGIEDAVKRLLARSPPPAGPWDLPWLGRLERGADDIERALARLVDPQARLRERLAWFYEGVAVEAVTELEPGNLRNALEGWSSASDPLAQHDAAVVAALACTVLDPDAADQELWHRGLRLWDRAISLEGLWMSVLRLEMEGGFETPATLEDIRQSRREGRDILAGLLVDVARQAIDEGHGERATRALGILAEAMTPTRLARVCGDLAHLVAGAPARSIRPATGPSSPPPAPRWPPAASEAPVERGFEPDPSTDPSDPASGGPGGDLWLWDLMAEADASPAESKPSPSDPPPSSPTTPNDAAAVSAGSRESHPPEGPASELLAPPPRPHVHPVPTRRAAPPHVEPGATPPVASTPAAPAPRRREDGRPSAFVIASRAIKRTLLDVIRRSRSMSRPSARLDWLPLAAGACCIALVTAGLFVALIASAVRPEAGAEGVATLRAFDELREIRQDMERNHARLAEALVERNRLDTELALIDGALARYGTLITEHEEALDGGESVDSPDLDRLVRQREVTLERRTIAREERAALNPWIQSLEQRDERLESAYNSMRRSVDGASR